VYFISVLFDLCILIHHTNLDSLHNVTSAQTLKFLCVHDITLHTGLHDIMHCTCTSSGNFQINLRLFVLGYASKRCTLDASDETTTALGIVHALPTRLTQFLCSCKMW
jgi:hypothetical protein